MKQFLHFQPKTTTFSLPYLVTRPDDSVGEALPMIVFLHGAGERGDDRSRLAVHGIPRYFDKNETHMTSASSRCPPSAPRARSGATSLPPSWN